MVTPSACRPLPVPAIAVGLTSTAFVAVGLTPNLCVHACDVFAACIYSSPPPTCGVCDLCTRALRPSCVQAFGGAQSSYGGSSYSSYYSDILSYNPYGLGWGYDDDANSFLGTNDYSGM